ncbi:Concanavalin A-like lectin protein kinase family protein [Euphorbia peplus]|nr:Concanavalin A-like lectin protein kinase family protein [Euphorbia peplus]
MGLYPYYCFICFLCSSAYVLVFIQSSSAYAYQDNKKIPSIAGGGPFINVSKQLIFPNFRLDNDPKTIHEIKLLGSAKFSNQNGGAIQIPDESQSTDLKHQAGRAIFSFPIRLFDPFTTSPASFHTSFSFHFSNSTHSNLVGGSGLTFIIVPDEFTVGRPGPWLAMLNDACQENYKAVAIEFDTRLNPEFGDPNDNHVGINLGSIISNITINASDAGISLKDGSVHQATISYDGSRRWMQIFLDFKPIFSDSLDLSPFLNEYMFVGFSASTGNLTQIHNILSWNFTSTSQATLRFPSVETCESKIYRQTGIAAETSGSNAEPVSSLVIFTAVMVLALAVFISIFYNRRRQDNGLSEIAIFPVRNQRPRPPNEPRRFTFDEISMATRCFNESEIMGNDSIGIYYRGKLSNVCQVAVKRFSGQFLNSQLGLDRRKLLKEIKGLSRIRHPNLVPIRGWCQDKRETIVLYELYPNGSLDKWLLGVGVLPWTRRLNVVKDVAEGLCFLHSKNVAHKNMKTTSVFLDVTFRAALGDFGFISPAGRNQMRADVFQFGVFVLEVVSGRGRVENELGKEEKDLVEFSWRMHEIGEKRRVIDTRMGQLVNIEEAISVMEIGLLCTLNENKGRPSMEQVLQFLRLDNPIPHLPRL